jgi:hypothetical protein
MGIDMSSTEVVVVAQAVLKCHIKTVACGEVVLITLKHV